MADDEFATLQLLNEARAVFRKRIQAHAGRLIDTAGDSVLAEFPSPGEAMDCADETQHELAKRYSQLADHRRISVAETNTRWQSWSKPTCLAGMSFTAGAQ